MGLLSECLIDAETYREEHDTAKANPSRCRVLIKPLFHSLLYLLFAPRELKLLYAVLYSFNEKNKIPCCQPTLMLHNRPPHL